VQVQEFSGVGTEEHEFLLSTGETPPGSQLTVELTAVNDGGAETRCLLEYSVDEATGIEDPPLHDLSVSALRSLYR